MLGSQQGRKAAGVDEREFEKVYWELHPQLLRHAKHYLDPTGAEDIASVTMWKVWDEGLAYPASVEEQRELRAFAFRVLTNNIRNEYRARKRRKNLRNALAAQEAIRPQYQDDTAATDSRLTIDRWLSLLSESDRDVILLFNAGFTAEKIANILGCSPSAAAKRCSRARTRLRSIVEAEGRSPL
jgi:RNA polymerase sigma factor (sigma-70 family)